MSMTETEIRAKLDVLCTRINESANPPVAVVWGQTRLASIRKNGRRDYDHAFYFSFRQGDLVVDSHSVGAVSTAHKLDMLTEQAGQVLTKEGRLKPTALRRRTGG